MMGKSGAFRGELLDAALDEPVLLPLRVHAAENNARFFIIIDVSVFSTGIGPADASSPFRSLQPQGREHLSARSERRRYECPPEVDRGNRGEYERKKGVRQTGSMSEEHGHDRDERGH